VTLETIENPSREKILARIKAALASPAPSHHAHSDVAPFPPVGDPLERFTKECAGNNTECVITPDLNASARSIAEILRGIPAGEIFIQDAPELRRMAVDWKSHTIRWSSEPAAKDGRDGPNECSQATITLTEGLVAMTGSVIVSSACGGRGAAMVAPLHIVVAKASQLFPDFDSAFAALKQRGTAMRNSYMCFITGSSRTADIEKILVMGAHGPRRLVVALALNE
jgi:L-lactate dehydrogenase complex protein LldG